MFHDEYVHRNPLCRHPGLPAPSHEPDALHRPDYENYNNQHQHHHQHHHHHHGNANHDDEIIIIAMMGKMIMMMER